MSLKFEWDPRKARQNIAKHGVSFDEALTVFADRLSITIADPDHSDEEDRFVTLGTSIRYGVLVVVHAERGESIRIITARRATRTERQQYEQGT